MGVIQTPDVALNAATMQVTAASVGPLTLASSAGDTTMMSPSITTIGELVQITVGGTFYHAGADTNSEVLLQVVRDSSANVFAIAYPGGTNPIPANGGIVSASWSFTDTPPPGAHTYAFIGAAAPINSLSTWGDVLATNVSASFTELRR